MAKKQTASSQGTATEIPVRRRILDAAFAAFMEQGFAATSTLDIATRARASKRELYALFGSKQEMLVACIGERATRLKIPHDWPEPRDADALAGTLVAFGTRLLHETSEPAVVAMFRLAIAEATRAPEVAGVLNQVGLEAGRAALHDIMTRACSAGLLAGNPAEMAALFAGILWGNQMIRLLFGIAERPGLQQISERAEAAARAVLQLHGASR
ncbi:MAG TPA: TetR/AcrR family transcriptional regulator [Bradyrhizobium sp.]|nr:TetR/AcrR family transcriptional regulator [Bradyrhizobium sp.]